jgi:rRNA maturation endonuclease Nob1
MVNTSRLIEKQFEKVYICIDCKRVLHLTTHHKLCPYCRGRLRVAYFTIKDVNKNTSVDERRRIDE